MTVGEIGRKARQIGNVSCIIIDYMGLISCSDDSRQKPRYEQLTEISAALKATAKALNIPILALCQLNRESTTRSDKRPTMADLRDSGAIEQDAGAIILLHRPDYYTIKESGETPEMEEIELNVAKNRHAEPGIVRMWWHGNVGKISMKATEQAELEELPF
jgi:replicative DNA helicase